MKKPSPLFLIIILVVAIGGMVMAYTFVALPPTFDSYDTLQSLNEYVPTAPLVIEGTVTEIRTRTPEELGIDVSQFSEGATFPSRTLVTLRVDTVKRGSYDGDTVTVLGGDNSGYIVGALRFADNEKAVLLLVEDEETEYYRVAEQGIGKYTKESWGTLGVDVITIKGKPVRYNEFLDATQE